MIFEHLYCPRIIAAVRKEVTICDVCQGKKIPTKKHFKLPAKLAEETLWNKICVDLIGTYKIRKKGKYCLILIDITIIDPITRWFEVTKHSKQKSVTIANLVELTRVVRYTWPVEITYEQGGESLGHKFKNSLI